MCIAGCTFALYVLLHCCVCPRKLRTSISAVVGCVELQLQLLFVGCPICPSYFLLMMTIVSSEIVLYWVCLRFSYDTTMSRLVQKAW
ncbi:hypothetical protein HanHA89_Chr16g0643581 [Helianthus annuus]|nr:hypothetical protein HanHA89_Chr16g0643581 [Helianthus annuus]